MRGNRKPRQVNRTLFLLAVFTAWTGLIIGRLVQLQVLQHDDFVQLALRQQQDTIDVEASRGVIYDRKMHELAVSVDVQTVIADPREISDPKAAAARLAPLLLVDPQALEEKLSADKAFVYLKRRLPFEQEADIRRAKIPGVSMVKESQRFFPHAELGGHLLGFVGIDNHGLSGLELLYEDELRGTPGKYFVERDAKQKVIRSEFKQPPVAGNTLVLNIDKNIQFIVEQELVAAVQANQAIGGAAIVMDPHSGEILALANYPVFDPNRYRSAPAETHRNRAVTDVYEPGSTFKIVTIGSALDEGVLDPAEQINCQNGSITLANHTVKDHTALGLLTYDEIMSHSSNVGAIKVGMRMGAERFYGRIIRFGIGRKTGVDLPGEVTGLLRKPEHWSGVSNGYVAMGYEVGVTPLQMLAAVSVVANGGYWVRPQVVQRVIRPTGELVRESVAEKRQVLQPRTVALMQKALEKVVLEGTGKAAQPPGYHVAGKTGTAKKQENGAYVPSKYVASFLGYAPASQPAFAAIVVIDEPHKGAYYGGEVAAPAFRAIAEKVLRYMNVAPDNQPPVHQLVKASPPLPESVTDTPESLGTESAAPADAEPQAENPYVVVLEAGASGTVMPDLRGKNIKSVLEICSDLGIEVSYEGSGLVAEQFPGPGAALAGKQACRVRLSRRSAGRPAAGNALAQFPARAVRSSLPVRSPRRIPTMTGSVTRPDGTFE